MNTDSLERGRKATEGLINRLADGSTTRIVIQREQGGFEILEVLTNKGYAKAYKGVGARQEVDTKERDDEELKLIYDQTMKQFYTEALEDRSEKNSISVETGVSPLRIRSLLRKYNQ